MRKIARRQFDAETQAGGHVLGETGVNTLEPDVAQAAPFQRGYFVPGGSSLCLKVTEVIRHLDLKPPIAVKKVLQPISGEVRSEILVSVVGGRGRTRVGPITTLILEVVLDIDHASGALWQHATCSHVENSASTRARPGCAGRQNRCPADQYKHCKFLHKLTFFGFEKGQRPFNLF